MKRPYQVVVTKSKGFFLYKDELLKLADLKQRWALEFFYLNRESIEDMELIFPDSKLLPRHSRELISVAKNIERFEVVDLQARFWPPKYKILRLENTEGETVLEPCTIGWDTVYYPEDYSCERDMTDEEINYRRIKAIAP